MISHTSRQKPPFGVFVATTIVIFFLSLSAADSVGFVPDYMDVEKTSTTAQTPSVPEGSNNVLALAQLPELGEEVDANVKTASPTRIKISSIDLDLTVQNPDTRDIAALDELLKNGPARYVDSAKLGQKGNMIVFAHSSHLPVVHNKMYKAFNRVPELVAGDTISLEGDDGKSYLYSVIEVRKADAEDTTIDLSATQGTRLTLVTCDTLTSKSSRFVLTAELVGTID